MRLQHPIEKVGGVLRLKYNNSNIYFHRSLLIDFLLCQDTPNPGAYDTHLNTFVKEVLARPMTYGFKSDGRRRDPQPLEPKGKDLLPGAYSVEDFAEQ